MTIAALDSAYPPSTAQIAAAKAAGYSGWNGYFAGQHILNGWSDADFARVHAGGLRTLAFCSGWADPTAMRIRGERLGIPIMLDCEGGIRGDGPWVQPWLNAAGAGLYANYWVFPGKHTLRNMLAAYPTSGDPSRAAWSVAYGPRPAGLCGWQWAGSHNFAGITVDSEWLDDAYYGVFGPSPGHIEEDDDMLYVSPFVAKAATIKAFAATSTYLDPSTKARVAGTLGAGATFAADGYRFSDSAVQSSDRGAGAGAGPDYVWWHATSGQWVPDAPCDTSNVAGAPIGAAVSTLPSLSNYFAVAGSSGPGAPDDDSQYATKADLQAVKDAIPTKASGNVTLSLSK